MLDSKHNNQINKVRIFCTFEENTTHGRKPVLKYLKIFGSTVYRLNKLRNGKFEAKSLKGILVGYETNRYKVWCLEQNKLVKARDVVVNEGCFIKNNNDCLNESNDQGSDHEDIKGLPNNYLENPCAEKENCKAKAGIDSQSKKPRLENTVDNESIDTVDNESIDETFKENDSVEERLRRSDRIRNQTKRNYELNNVYCDNYVMYTQNVIDDIPNSYSEIEHRTDKSSWLEAIESELESHKINQTWSLVEKPIGKNIVDSKWTFTIKTDEHGNQI